MLSAETTTAEAPTASEPPAPAAASPKRRARRRRRTVLRALRWSFLVLLVVSASIAAVFAFRPQPVTVEIARTAKGPLTVAVQESGMTRLKDSYVISAPVTGSLLRIALKPNDTVEEGQVLARIAPADSPLLDKRAQAEAEAHLAAARSALQQAQSQTQRAGTAKEQAQLELVRSRKLAASGTISQQALDQAEFAARMRADELASAVFARKVTAEELRRAKAVLTQQGARGAQDRHVDVVSPIPGRVLRLHEESAGVVSAGTPLLEIGDPAVLEIVVDLLTTDAVNVRPGTRAIIEGWGKEQPLEGRVRDVELAGFTRPSALGVDEQRTNVIVVLTADRERWSTLGDAYRVEVKLILWEGRDVVKVPLGSVFRHGERWAVYRVTAGKAELVAIELGHRGESDVEVLSGLSVGDQVVVHPGDRMSNGVEVEAAEGQPVLSD